MAWEEETISEWLSASSSIVWSQIGFSVSRLTAVCFSLVPTRTMTYGSDVPLASATAMSE
eukprot:3668798-Rhodomonas_salina.3